MKKWLALIFVVAAIGVSVATCQHWLPALAFWLDVGRKPQFAEYAMIMGGGVENRPFVAAALRKKHWVKKILVSELREPPGTDDRFLPPEHELTQAILVRLGVPAKDVLILRGQHAATFHEIESLQELLAREPQSRVLIVTDDVHTRRTRWSVIRLLGKDANRVIFISAPSDRYDLARWWQSDAGFFMVTSEYLKLAFYSVRYGSGGCILAAAALLLLGGILWKRLCRATTVASASAAEPASNS